MSDLFTIRSMVYLLEDEQVLLSDQVSRVELYMYICIRTVHRTGHDCRSANAVWIRNVNTVLLNGKIVIFKIL